MSEPGFIELVEELCRKDTRFHREAYVLVRDALDFTAKKLRKPAKGQARHVTGKELLDGLRQFALREYGPMTRTVLRTWGLNRTEDFGELVFRLVESGRLGKTDNDHKEDFAGGYDFREAFEEPFLPAARKAHAPETPRRRTRRRKATTREQPS